MRRAAAAAAAAAGLRSLASGRGLTLKSFRQVHGPQDFLRDVQGVQTFQPPLPKQLLAHRAEVSSGASLHRQGCVHGAPAPPAGPSHRHRRCRVSLEAGPSPGPASHLFGLVKGSLGVRLHLVARVTGNLGNRLFKDGGRLSDWQRRVEVRFTSLSGAERGRVTALG